jgi:hypothetical protein
MGERKKGTNVIKIFIDADRGGYVMATLFNKHLADLLVKAGMPVDERPVFLRTPNGLFAYKLDDGLDGPEHVFTWVGNDEKLTGELLCNNLVERGPGYSVFTSRKPKSAVVVTLAVDDEEEL